MFGFLNPVLLLISTEAAKEKLRNSDVDNAVEKAKLFKKLKKLMATFTRIQLCLEVFYQVSAQIILWLLNRTKTSTTGGLESVFEADTKILGIYFNPEAALALSIALSLKTCITTHLGAISKEKIFFPMTSKIIVVIWAIFSTCRRLLAIVIFFVPSFGLLDLLYHWKAEQIPFKVRLKNADNYQISTFLKLHGLKEETLWLELDRWNQDDSDKSTPPEYSLYTGLSLGNTFILFLIMTVLQLLVLYFVKNKSSMNFRRKSERRFNKIVHILENLNISFPWQDWDEGECCSVEQFRKNHDDVKREMFRTFGVNSFFSIIMLVPLWYTGKIII